MNVLRRVWPLVAALLFVPATAFADPPEPAGSAAPAHDAAAAHDAAPAPAKAGDEKKHKADDDDDDEPKKGPPITMTVGLDIANFGKLDLTNGSYSAEFYLTIDCSAPCKPDIDVANGKISGKPEKLLDEPTHKEWKMKADLIGDIDLSNFPFDEHYLPIILIDKSNPTGTKFVIDKKSEGIDEDVKLAGWDIIAAQVEIEKDKIPSGEEIQQYVYGVGIHRPRVAGFFKTILPACFMIFVALFTLLLKPKSAPGRLTAATGALMTVVMFHISSTSSLPPLGYLTRMDKFMIRTYFVYLVNIGFAVAIVRFEEAKNEKASNLAYLAAMGAVPGVAVVTYALVFLGII